MKRLLVVLVCLMLLAGSAAPALACRRHQRSYAGYRTRYQPRYSRATYYRGYATPSRTYYAYRDRRSFWQRHRDALTLAIGTGGGAAGFAATSPGALPGTGRRAKRGRLGPVLDFRQCDSG